MSDYHYKTCHALDAALVLESLQTHARQGLSQQQAQERLQQFGPNLLPTVKPMHPFIHFIRQFHNILIYVLLLAAVITTTLGHYVDSMVIVLVAVINALIGFIQENKAEKALAGIKSLLSPKADVIRDGVRREIDAAQLTPGDLVLLDPGDKVPADLRLIRADNLLIEESPLTGESVPVQKSTVSLPDDTMLGDRVNMAFSGTTISAGTGLGVVVAVGACTEIGRISEMLSQVEPITTPLIRQTTRFGTVVSLVIVAMAVLIYLFAYFFRNYDSAELLMAVIGLAVAAIPEGLPAILSIILAIGVQNMARRKAIVRNLPSVETLGAVSIICSDKTGTLTKNEMTVTMVVTKNQEFQVRGTGYANNGKVCYGGEVVDFSNQHVLEELIRCFKECNESELGLDENGNITVKGDPTEGALITLYEKADIDHTPARRLDTIPFDSNYKYMAVLVEGTEYNSIYIKGAPDRLLDMAGRQCALHEIEPFDAQYWDREISVLANQGLRIIGAAGKRVDKSVTSIDHSDIQDNIMFLGLAGIIDPPREEAVAAVAECARAGITVKMVTGDHADTAKAIGWQIGIGDGVNAITGRELEAMDDEQFAQAAITCNVFARTSPEHKLRLVSALQDSGAICAMTGDGVNDAPALKKADVGIAMGIKGTEVTKDAAEMVLADDNFATIAAAVEEGRRVYDNLKKTILFILPTNGAQSFLIIASIIFATAMPLTPVQILWVNMVTAVTVSLALAFEKLEPGTMERPPRPANTPLLNGYFIWRILFVSILIGGATLCLDVYMDNQGFDRTLISTVTLQTIVLCQMFHLFNNRSISEFAINRQFFSNRVVFVVCALLIVLQAGITYLPFMNMVFGTTPMSAYMWVYPIALGLMVFVVVEIEKAIMRKLKLISSV